MAGSRSDADWGCSPRRRVSASPLLHNRLSADASRASAFSAPRRAFSWNSARAERALRPSAASACSAATPSTFACWALYSSHLAPQPFSISLLSHPASLGPIRTWTARHPARSGTANAAAELTGNSRRSDTANGETQLAERVGCSDTADAAAELDQHLGRSDVADAAAEPAS